MNLSMIDKKKLLKYICYGFIFGLCLYTALLLFRGGSVYAKGPGVDTVHLKQHPALQKCVGDVRIFFLGSNKLKYRAFVHKLDNYIGDGCKEEQMYYELCETIRTYDPSPAHAASGGKRSFMQKLLFQTVVSKSWRIKQEKLLSVLLNTFNVQQT